MFRLVVELSPILTPASGDINEMKTEIRNNSDYRVVRRVVIGPSLPIAPLALETSVYVSKVTE